MESIRQRKKGKNREEQLSHNGFPLLWFLRFLSTEVAKRSAVSESPGNVHQNLAW